MKIKPIRNETDYNEALYTRPPQEQRLPHDEVMALPNCVRGER